MGGEFEGGGGVGAAVEAALYPSLYIAERPARIHVYKYDLIAQHLVERVGDTLHTSHTCVLSDRHRKPCPDLPLVFFAFKVIKHFNTYYPILNHLKIPSKQ